MAAFRLTGSGIAVVALSSSLIVGGLINGQSFGIVLSIVGIVLSLAVILYNPR